MELQKGGFPRRKRDEILVSPFHITVAVEILSRVVSRDLNEGPIQGIGVKDDQFQAALLQFAVDSNFLSNSEENQVELVRGIGDLYILLSEDNFLEVFHTELVIGRMPLGPQKSYIALLTNY